MTTEPSRRRFLGLTGLAGVGVAACSGPADRHDVATHPSTAVTATGRHQAGVVTPQPPQPNLLMTVYDLHANAAPAPVLAAVGQTVLALSAGRHPGLLGLAPGDLTVTVGVGPRLVAAVDRDLPGAEAMPTFGAHEQLAPAGSGGDLVVQVCASDPLVVSAAAAAVGAAAGQRWTVRWQQAAFRGQNVPITGSATAPRNLLGFVDGIVGPRTAREYDADVWLTGPAPVAGGTIMAVRRMVVDTVRFAALPLAEQERVFGRTRAGAHPLTGGTIATDPDLGAKTPAGAYVIPANAHLRRANPASTGVPTMLRRSYSFDTGLLFISFQSALHTFTATLNRMTGADALLPFTTTTHAGTFLVLPGFEEHRPLGCTVVK